MTINIFNSSETLMVKYYFALEHELPIANGSSFTKVVDEIQHSIRGLPVFITDGILNTAHYMENPKKFFSMGFYQVPMKDINSWDSGIEAIHKALAVQGNQKSEKFLDSLNRKNNHIDAVRTVVSIVTIVEPNTESFNNLKLPISLVESINVLTRFVNAFRLRMHYPYEVNQETLHSGVMRTSETLDGKIIDQRIIPLRSRSQKASLVSEKEFHSLVECFQRNEAKDPMLRYLAYKNSGEIDLNQNGLYSSACMNFGIASEILLSSVLSLALWEDFMKGNISEEESAEIMALPLAKRVKANYPHRFGGNIIEILDKWNANIAIYRHQVAHSGYELPKESAVRSVTTLNKLHESILDILQKRISRYPRTVWLILGENELRKRNVIKSARRQKEILTSLGDSGEELNWLRDYGKWMEGIAPLIRSKRSSNG